MDLSKKLGDLACKQGSAPESWHEAALWLPVDWGGQPGLAEGVWGCRLGACKGGGPRAACLVHFPGIWPSAVFLLAAGGSEREPEREEES